MLNGVYKNQVGLRLVTSLLFYYYYYYYYYYYTFIIIIIFFKIPRAKNKS